MRILKNILAQLHRFVFWAMTLSLFWAWIYVNFVGDCAPEKKVVVCVNACALESRELAVRLEEESLPAGIRMIQVRDFDYELFGSAVNGDVYLMQESILRATLEQSPDKLREITLPAGTSGFQWNGKTWGILAYDPETRQGPAMDYILYAPRSDGEQEAYYLCFDAAGLHLAGNEGAVDDAAREVGLALLRINH